MAAQSPDEQELAIARRVRKHAAAVEALPPTPVRLHYGNGQQRWPSVIVHRTAWSQVPQTFTMRQPGSEGEVSTEGDVARQIRDTPNPLRSLATALVAAADELDAADLVPLGLTVSTAHVNINPFGYHDQSLRGACGAVVSVSTTAVRGVDVEQALTESAVTV